MNQALRDKFGKVAYTAFYGKYADWDTLAEDVRDKWRDAAECVAVLVVAHVVEPVQALGRGEMSPAGVLEALRRIFMEQVV